jgi:hypothetical protein
MKRELKSYPLLRTDGVGMNTVGTQGAVAGKGAQVLILDDPHKDREQAESLTMR